MKRSRSSSRCGDALIRPCCTRAGSWLGLWLWFACALPGQELPTQQSGPKEADMDFQRHILPVFQANCLACHSSSKAKGGLNLETPQAILQGGDSGPVIVPGKGRESFLYQVAAGEIPDTLMPPKDNASNAHPLTASELERLLSWIDQGARGEVTSQRPILWQHMPKALKAVHAVSLSPDGQWAACNRANQIDLYHLSPQTHDARLMDPSLSWEENGKWEGAAHLDLIQSLAYSPDSRLLASGGYRVVKLWERQIIQRRASMHLPSEGVDWVPVVGHPMIALLSPDTPLQLWDITTQQAITLAASTGGKPRVIQPSPDRQWIAVADEAQGLQMISMSDTTRLARWPTPSVLTELSWGSQVGHLWGRDAEGVMYHWIREDSPSQPLVLQDVWMGHEGTLRLMALLPGKDFPLLTVAASGRICFWSGADGKLQSELQAEGPVEAACIDPASRLLALQSMGIQGPEIQIRTLETDGTLGPQSPMQVHADNGLRLDAAERKVQQIQSWAQALKTDLEALEGDIKKSSERQEKAEEALKSATEAQETHREKTNTSKLALQRAKDQLKQFEDRIENTRQALGLANEALKVARQTLMDALSQRTQVSEAPSTTQLAGLEAIEKGAMAVGKAQEQYDQACLDQDARRAALENEIQTHQKTFEDLEKESPALEMKLALAMTESSLAVDEASRLEASRKQIEASQATNTSMEGSAQRAWDELKQVLAPGTLNLRHMAFNFSGDTLGALRSDGTLLLWRTRDGLALDQRKLGLQDPRSLHCDPETKAWWITSTQQWMESPAHPSWQLVGQLGDGSPDSPILDRVNALSFSPDGKQLAIGGGIPSRGGEVQIWDVAQRRLLENLDRIHSDAVLSLAYSPDGQWLASAASDRMIRITRTSSWEVFKTLEGHTHHVMGVSWKSDGRTLATSGADRLVKIWDVFKAQRKKNIEGFGKEVGGVCFVGLSDQLVAVSGDAKLRMLDVQGKEIRSFEGIQAFQHAIDITPDGRTLVTGGADGQLLLFDTEEAKPTRAFELP